MITNDLLWYLSFNCPRSISIELVELTKMGTANSALARFLALVYCSPIALTTSVLGRYPKRQSPRRCGQSDAFPKRVTQAANILSIQPAGPFTLSHPDFGYHNFIVDNDYNILAVIDWAGARVQLIEFSAAFPMFLSSLHSIFWKGGKLDNKKYSEG